MIKITPFLNDKSLYCKNCGRVTPLMLTCYIDGADEFNKKFSLCEDCSNALSNLHYLAMENSEEFKYDKDEYINITKNEVHKMKYMK